MSRPNKPREVYAEDYLAARISSEREARGWSLDGLAKRMTDAGCAINQSAIYKIEQGQPRRRITVDELVAFSRVFDLTLDDLLTDPELWQAKRLAPLLDEWQRNQRRYMDLIHEADRREGELTALIRAAAADSPLSHEIIERYLTSILGDAKASWPPGTPEISWPARLTKILLEED